MYYSLWPTDRMRGEGPVWHSCKAPAGFFDQKNIQHTGGKARILNNRMQFFYLGIDFLMVFSKY
jgi:ribosomal protein S4E